MSLWLSYDEPWFTSRGEQAVDHRRSTRGRADRGRCKEAGMPGSGVLRLSGASLSLSSLLRCAAQARWPSAILDRGCARRLGVVRPGRRNGPFQPNQETSQLARAAGTFGQGFGVYGDMIRIA